MRKFSTDGKYLGIPGEVLASPRDGGRTMLNFHVKANELGDYVNKGLSDEFIRDFIIGFVLMAGAGVDMAVYTHYNSAYSPDTRDLELFDCTSVRTPRYNEARARAAISESKPYVQSIQGIYQDHPLMSVLRLLITDFQLFASTRVQEVREKIEEAAQQQGIGPQDFWDRRFEQLKRVVLCLPDYAAEHGIDGLDRESIRAALEKLRAAQKNPNPDAEPLKQLIGGLGGYPKYITPEGEQYLDQLIAAFQD
jgi:hypothetical protein